MEQKFACKNCGDEFDSEERLNRHKSWQCKDKRCNNCDCRFKRMRDLESHQKNNENLECHHCLRKFCNQDHLQRHLRTISVSKKSTLINQFTHQQVMKSIRNTKRYWKRKTMRFTTKQQLKQTMRYTTRK